MFQGNRLVAVLAVTALAFLILLAWAACVVWRARATRKVVRSASWVVEVAQTIVADISQAAVQSAPATYSRNGKAAARIARVTQRLQELGVQASAVYSRHQLLLATRADLGLLSLAREATTLQATVLRLVLVRSQVDAALREWSEALSISHSGDDLATVP
jgi:hypothetical protein